MIALFWHIRITKPHTDTHNPLLLLTLKGQKGLPARQPLRTFSFLRSKWVDPDIRLAVSPLNSLSDTSTHGRVGARSPKGYSRSHSLSQRLCRPPCTRRCGEASGYAFPLLALPAIRVSAGAERRGGGGDNWWIWRYPRTTPLCIFPCLASGVVAGEHRILWL